MEELLLRHFLATLKYRCTKVIMDVPVDYPDFDVGSGVRTPREILSHMSHVLRCAQSIFIDSVTFDIGVAAWDAEVNRFHNEIEYLDSFMEKAFLTLIYRLNIQIQNKVIYVLTNQTSLQR